MAALQQTNPAGGPNPNSPPGGFGVSIADLPQFAATGGAQAADVANQRQYLQSLYQQRQGAALAPTVTPTPAPAPAPTAPITPGPAAYAPGGSTLPAFDNSYVPPARGSNSALTGLGNMLDPNSQAAPVERETANLRNAVDPGVSGAIYNWVANPVGGPDAQAYHERVAAGSVYADPNATSYFGQHPDLMTHAQADPMGFSKLLGPILEAHAAEQAGTHKPMPVTVQTRGGPEVHMSPNGAKTDAIAKGFNLPLDKAHILANPGMYSTQDFTNGIRGISRGAINNMWQMQHYLNPQQQAEAQYLSGANASNNPGYLDSVLRTISLGANSTLASPKPGTEPAK